MCGVFFGVEFGGDDVRFWEVVSCAEREKPEVLVKGDCGNWEYYGCSWEMVGMSRYGFIIAIYSIAVNRS